MTDTLKHQSGGINQGQILLFPAKAPARANKPVWLLFSLMQVADIIRKPTLLPVPLSPDYVLGLSQWQDEVLPVLSMENLFGMETEQHDPIDRLAVVRTVVNTHHGIPKEMKTMISVAANFQQRSLPMVSAPVSPGSWVSGSAQLKGAFESEDKIILVPDLGKILKGSSTFSLTDEDTGTSVDFTVTKGTQAATINMAQAGV